MIQLLQAGILNESLIQIETKDYTKSVVAIHLHQVNPFDQPVVKAYKKKMLELLQVENVKKQYGGAYKWQQ